MEWVFHFSCVYLEDISTNNLLQLNLTLFYQLILKKYEVSWPSCFRILDLLHHKPRSDHFQTFYLYILSKLPITLHLLHNVFILFSKLVFLCLLYWREHELMNIFELWRLQANEYVWNSMISLSSCGNGPFAIAKIQQCIKITLRVKMNVLNSENIQTF